MKEANAITRALAALRAARTWGEASNRSDVFNAAERDSAARMAGRQLGRAYAFLIDGVNRP